jgi:hypothetical protein
MRLKPWPLLILAACHFLSPVWTAFVSARLLGISFWNFTTENILHGGLYDQLSLLLFPLAGYAIASVERWSYRVYLAAMACITANNIRWWYHFPVPLGLPWVILIQAINISVVSYFLHPKIRTVYYTDAIKWWKSKPRYPLSAPCYINRGLENNASARAANISEGGLFIHHPLQLFSGEEISLRLAYDDTIFLLAARVVFTTETPEGRGSGIRFLHTPQSRKTVKAIIKSIKATGVEPRSSTSLLADFRSWLSELLHTGKGLFPDAPARPSTLTETGESASSEKAA